MVSVPVGNGQASRFKAKDGQRTVTLDPQPYTLQGQGWAENWHQPIVGFKAKDGQSIVTFVVVFRCSSTICVGLLWVGDRGKGEEQRECPSRTAFHTLIAQHSTP